MAKVDLSPQERTYWRLATGEEPASIHVEGAIGLSVQEVRPGSAEEHGAVLQWAWSTSDTVHLTAPTTAGTVLLLGVLSEFDGAIRYPAGWQPVLFQDH